MKNLLLALSALIISFSSKAQEIAVNNLSGCDATIVVYAEDASNTGCMMYISNPFTVTSATAYNDTWANFATNIGWTGGTPSSGSERVNGYKIDYAPSTSCSGNSVIIWFKASCGSTNCANRVYCSGCSSNANPKACPTIPGGGPYVGDFLCILQDLP